MNPRIIFLLVLVCSSASLFAEGTKQLRPASSDFGYIQINDKGRTFATYVANEDERLYIHINGKQEKIYFGFGRVTDGSNQQTDVWFRIKDPSGTTVMGPTKIPTTGNGFISSYSRAVAGPTKINVSGYPALIYAPNLSGDYYIEFNQGSASTIQNPNTNKRIFEDIDITVIDTTNNSVKNGRLWSKNWDITSNGGSNAFKGSFFVYSNDGVVTSINLNGIQPHAFRVACNSTGCVNTGNPALDRQSRLGNFTYSSYKIFLNDPDITAYPSGVIGNLQTEIKLTGCAPNYCLNVTTDAPGYMEFFVNLNGVPGYQNGTADLIFGQNVNAGTTCLPWDGNDGLGRKINQDVVFEINAEYKFGLTNFPIFDAENFNNGLIVSSIRPSIIKPKLFWDDSNIPGGSSNLVGCTNNACHAWPNSNFGDERTINTWWYVNVVRDTIYSSSISKPAPQIKGTSSFCEINKTTSYYTDLNIGNGYTWTSKRNNIVGSNNNNSINYKTSTGIDTLLVLESTNLGCYEDTLIIYCYPIPSPDIIGDSTACNINTVDIYTTNNNSLNSFTWEVQNGIIESGQGTNTIQVKWTTLGIGNVKITEKNPLNCSTIQSKNVRISPKPILTEINH